MESLIEQTSALPTCVTSAIPVLDLQGSRFDIGVQHGVCHRAAIHTFLNDRLTRINAVLNEPVSLASLGPSISAYQRVIAERLPAMYQELQGLAAGAAISIEQALLLQLRRELAGFKKVSGDCTTFARLTTGQGGMVLGQTIDLNGDMERELTALRVRNSVSGHSVLLLSFTGLLGYLGMNDRGVAIGLNLVLGGTWGPGVPGYMAIRHLLEEAGSVDECLMLLRDLPLASSRALTICDASKLVTVEYIKDEWRVLEAQNHTLVHTNHFLDMDFAVRDALNPFARTSSVRRLAACSAGLDNLALNCDADAYFKLLGSKPIYVADNGDPRRECTVAAVVMRPADGHMLIRKGNPATAPSECLAFMT